jgi:flagellar basal-body rod protein FlgC
MKRQEYGSESADLLKRIFSGLELIEGMSTVLAIAVSGMAAASRRLEVSASNVANSSTTGPLPDANTSGFPPAYTPLRIDQVDVGGGTSATVTPVSPSYVPTYDPSAPYADKNGMVAAPNVDFVNEFVQQITARYAFAANAKVIQADSRMLSTLLDIKA